jgi:hypothetical protein
VNRHGLCAAIVLGAGFLAMLALNWPGQMSYDSVMQLADARAGFYHSWHPPVMAWLLGVFDRLLSGTGLFILFNGALAAFAFLTFAQPRRAGILTVLLALLAVLTPQWLLYQGMVWKDVLFADAALAGFAALGLAARGRHPLGAILLAVLLLSLAAMTRQNGLVILPIAALVLAAIAARHVSRRRALGGALAFLGVTLALVLGGNRLLLAEGDRGADAADEIRTAQAYDLTGMLKRDPAFRPARLEAEDPALARMLLTRGTALYSPAWIDPFLNDPALHDAIAAAPDGLVFAQWRQAVTGHAGLYLATRWAVFAWVLATPDLAACHALFTGIDGPPDVMAALGLQRAWRPQDRAHNAYGLALLHTGLFSHLLFGTLALVLLPLLIRRRDLAAAGLLLAALAFAASFFVVSIACDYRYLYFLDLAAMAGALAAAARPERLEGNRPGPGGEYRARTC